MHVPAAANKAFDPEADADTADVGCDVVGRGEPSGFPAVVAMDVLKELGKPDAEVLPGEVDADDDDAQDREHAHEVAAPESRRRIGDGRGFRRVDLVLEVVSAD